MAKPKTVTVDAKLYERLERASELLVEAYDNGEANGGSVEWNDLDLAYNVADEALKRRKKLTGVKR